MKLFIPERQKKDKERKCRTTLTVLTQNFAFGNSAIDLPLKRRLTLRELHQVDGREI